MNQALLLGSTLLLLPAACMVGPDYQRPTVVLPEGWRELDGTQGESLANLPWWQLFQDPVLHELVRAALQQNKDLQVAVERIEEARARYGFSRADLLPTLDAVAFAGRERVSGETPAGAALGSDLERSYYGLGASLTWELDLFGRIRRASEAERALMYAAEQTRRAVVLALVAEVARAYVELRDLDRRLEISLATLVSRREYRELVRVRFEGGITSELDLRQAEGEVHRTASQVHDLERQVGQKENELNLLLGRNPGPIPRGQTPAAMALPPRVPAGLPAQLLERRPDLRAAEEQLVSANARIGEAKALLYPTISITGFLGFESEDLGDLLGAPARSWSIGGNLLQPIFNAGRNTSRVEVAESQQRQALFRYEQSILQAFREVEDGLIAYRKTGERRNEEGGRVAAERQVLALAELRYRGDVAPYLDVLDAQRQLFDAELNEAVAVRDQWLALILLYRSLGGGWPTAPEPAEKAPDQG